MNAVTRIGFSAFKYFFFISCMICLLRGQRFVSQLIFLKHAANRRFKRRGGCNTVSRCVAALTKARRHIHAYAPTVMHCLHGKERSCVPLARARFGAAQPAGACVTWSDGVTAGYARHCSRTRDDPAESRSFDTTVMISLQAR